MRWQILNLVSPVLGYFAGLNTEEFSAILLLIAAGVIAGMVGAIADGRVK